MIRSLFQHIKNVFYRPFVDYPDAENNDPIVELEVSSSGKRQNDENSLEVCLKKRKLDLTNSADLDGPFSPLDVEKMPSNQIPQRKNTRARSKKVFSNGSPNTSKMNTIKASLRSYSSLSNDVTDEDNSDGLIKCKVMLRSTESTPGNEDCCLRKMNSLNTQQGSSQTRSPFSSHLCQRSRSCLDRIEEEKGRQTYCEIVKKCTGASAHKRKPLPLTTSALHNTKQNNQAVSNTIPNKGYYFRHSSALSKSSSNEETTMDPIEVTVADRTVIDLTGEEDDYQLRKILETDARNSPRLKNFRSSFVGNTSQTSPSCITNMLKKYSSKQRNLRSQVQKLKQDMRKDKEDFHKTLVECLEERLVLKEHVPDKKRTKDLAPMTEAMMEDVQKVLSSGRKTLVQIKDTGIKAQDIYTLHDSNWLNDEVINAYMNLIKNRSETDEKMYPRVHCFNTFFYPQLLNRGYTSVRRWTKKIDIFDHPIIVVPIHLGNHWCLVEIRTAEKAIKYYDSLGSPNNRCLETMLHYLTSEYEDKKGGKFNAKDWQVINVPRDEIPNQKNAYDCGVFACTYAEHITRNESFSFDQGDMSYFREKMTYEILTGKLLL